MVSEVLQCVSVSSRFCGFLLLVYRIEGSATNFLYVPTVMWCRPAQSRSSSAHEGRPGRVGDLRGERAQDGRVLPASMIITRRLQAQEYVGGEVVGESPVAATDKTSRGHDFRYSRMDCARDSRFVYRFTVGSWTTRTDGAKRAGDLSARSVGVRIRWIGSWGCREYGVRGHN